MKIRNKYFLSIKEETQGLEQLTQGGRGRIQQQVMKGFEIQVP